MPKAVIIGKRDMSNAIANIMNPKKISAEMN